MGPETLAFAIPLTALMIPIVAVLAKHQQKMAEIMRSVPHNQPQLQSPEVAQLRQEVAELKQILHRQMIQLDDLAQRSTASVQAPQEPLHERLNP